MGTMLKELRYSLYLTTHPFKGFWEIKHENRGSLRTAVFWLAAYTLLSVLSGFCTAYLFNQDGGVNFNVYKSVATTLALFFLWCISNWCHASLYDGEGKFVDIVKATAYALIPLVLVNIILIPMSYALVLAEASFYTMLTNLGYVWMAFLLFSGTLVTHQYTFGKTVLMIIFILLGMCMIAYIALLFFNLIQQMSGFVVTFWTELKLRMG